MSANVITIHQYKVFCNDEEIYKTVWSETEPTVCPSYANHAIDIDKTTKLKTVTQDVQKVDLQTSVYHDGRLSIHVTPRPSGTVTWNSGRGDDPDDMMDIGGGQLILIQHALNSGMEVNIQGEEYLCEHKYVDFNIMENPSAIFSAEIQAYNASYALCSCEIVPRVTPTTTGSGTYFNAVPYHGIDGCLIVPAAGNGTLVVDPNDIQPVQVLTKENAKVPGTGFWNLDYDTVTHTFSNLTAAPLGDGAYNLFAAETCLNTFVNDRIINCPGRNDSSFIRSKDAEMLPHGIRFKISLKVRKAANTTCEVGISLMMYRKLTCR